MNKLCKKILLTKIILWLSVATSFSYAQGRFEGIELSIVPVAGNVYMVQRSEGNSNIGVQVGPDGVLLVDSMFGELSDKLVAAVQEVSDEEIRFLINTHVHRDHVSGNENLAQMGVLIFAHDNTRLRFFTERFRGPRAGGVFGPQQPAAARPLITFNDTINKRGQSKYTVLYIYSDPVYYFSDPIY